MECILQRRRGPIRGEVASEEKTDLLRPGQLTGLFSWISTWNASKRGEGWWRGKFFVRSAQAEESGRSCRSEW